MLQKFRWIALLAAAPLDTIYHTIGGVSASLVDTDAPVLFAGLTPLLAGLYQVNILVPQLPPGDHPLQVFAGGVPSNIAPVSIR